MRTKTHFFYAFVVFALIQSCSPKGEIDRKAIAEEMDSREIRKVSSSEIIQKGLILGKQIQETVEEEFETRLAGREAGNMDICLLEGFNSVNKLNIKGISVYRVNNHFRNPKNEPDSLELLIFEAYQYAKENGLKLDPTLQEENNNMLLYTTPIYMKESCKSCHGVSGIDISEEDELNILVQYPEDSAKDYEPGQFMAMWSIRIPRSEIINSL